MGWGGGRNWAAGGHFAAGGGLGGRGGGKGVGGKTPWSFFRVCDDQDSLGLLALSRQIPDAWVDWRHGGKRKAERMHSTVILNMTSPAHLERLKRLAWTTPPAHVTIRELFCSRVDRIQDAEVYCIGVGLASPGVRALKDAWAAEEPDEEQRRKHVPYDSEGHISLAYVLSSCRQQAESFVAEHQGKLGGGLSVTAVTYEDAQGKESTIPLAGAAGSTGAGEPPAKRARKTAAGPPMEIDGSVLEGGGQILRMSSAYSALFGVPLRISKIRAGRSKPGLAAQHLESLRLVRDVSGGSLTNDQIGSCQVAMVPGPLSPGSFSADPGTAGAITLMVQASLFPLMFTGGECVCELRGGTDVGFSPPFDFLRRVLRPTLGRMGAWFTAECTTRGFFPRGGGHVRLMVPALSGELQPIDMSERGEPIRVETVLHTTKALGSEEKAALDAVRSATASLAPQAHVEVAMAPMPKNDFKHKYWVDIVVRTNTAALFHGGSEPKELKGGGGLAQLFAAVAAEGAKKVEQQLATGAAVGEHLCDQLILPASLAAGTSQLLAAEPSMHTRTAIHIAELLVPGVVFNVEKQGALSLIEVHGIGLTPDQAGGGPLPVAAPPAAPAAAPARPAPAAPLRAAPAPPARQVPRPPVRRVGPPPAGGQEAVQLKAGALAYAAPQLLADLRNDLRQLCEGVGLLATTDVKDDRVVLQGGEKERSAARNDLRELLEFYFGKDGVVAAA